MTVMTVMTGHHSGNPARVIPGRFARLGLALARRPWLSLVLLVLVLPFQAHAERISDIRNTRHNLSATDFDSGSTDRRLIKADEPVDGGTTEICVFCHTPHGASFLNDGTTAVTPLWNRYIDEDQSYTPYDSSSIDAYTSPPQPTGESKLCLSCHDGTIAIGAVTNAPGPGLGSKPVRTDKTSDVMMTTRPDTGSGFTQDLETKMLPGEGTKTGFTRFLDTDLSNDHPISFEYTQTLANTDGELRDPTAVAHIGERGAGITQVPLYTGELRCTTCHDPHIRDDTITYNIKFLRESRFQKQDSTAAATGYTSGTDIVCLACHDKDGWYQSAHATVADASEEYLEAAAQLREFPNFNSTPSDDENYRASGNIQVWEAACLNCHDTHTVQGADRLLREGTCSSYDSTIGGGTAPENATDALCIDSNLPRGADGVVAYAEIQETCYQCHTSTGSILSSTLNDVPDIKQDFAELYRMPITNYEQTGTTTADESDRHDIVDADFTEDVADLGLTKRHVECTDCHNPHRVAKNTLFNRLGAATQGTHAHEVVGTNHTNIASGVLRGTSGVEPTYKSAANDGYSFYALPDPSGFIELKGLDEAADLTINVATDQPSNLAVVTREYQVCFRCHSNYAYPDDQAYPGPDAEDTDRPPLGWSVSLTPAPTDRTDYTHYTNQAREFQAPDTHKGEGQDLGHEAGACSGVTNTGVITLADVGPSDVPCTAYNTNNHRSWHPVMRETGRTNAASSNWEEPWDNNQGSQTMYCSDCHGVNSVIGSSAPPAGDNWGPHGSENPFILRGLYTATSGDRDSANTLCLKCHVESCYAISGDSCDTGFQTGSGDGHEIHNKNGNLDDKIACNWCHVAVPHGWKNKALLVNLNDVGPEADPVRCPLGACEVAINGNNNTYSVGPYYRNAKLKVINFATSGSWSQSDCGSNGAANRSALIPRDGGGTSNNSGNGQGWMEDVCDNPP